MVSTQFRIRSTARSPAAMSTPAAAYALGSSRHGSDGLSTLGAGAADGRRNDRAKPVGLPLTSAGRIRAERDDGGIGPTERGYGRVSASAAPAPAVTGWRSSTSTGVAPSEAASSSTYLPSRALSGSSTG